MKLDSVRALLLTTDDKKALQLANQTDEGAIWTSTLGDKNFFSNIQAVGFPSMSEVPVVLDRSLSKFKG